MKTTIRLCTLAIACTAGLSFAQGAGDRMAEYIKKIDTNGDGKISKEEFMANAKKEAEERFAKVDANGDGVIDESEIKAAAEKVREAGGRRGEGAMRRGEGPEGQTGGFRRPPGTEGGTPPPQGERPAGRRPEEGARPEGKRPEGAGPEGRRPEGGAGGPGGMLGNPEELFKHMDKNGDGVVDAAEFREASSQELDNRFKRLDQNGDGKITLEEFKTGTERVREFMRRGGAGGQGGEGGMRRPPGGPGGAGGEGNGGGFRRPPSDEPAAPKKEGA